jgi:hypothetical protein
VAQLVGQRRRRVDPGRKLANDYLTRLFDLDGKDLS